MPKKRYRRKVARKRNVRKPIRRRIKRRVRRKNARTKGAFSMSRSRKAASTYVRKKRKYKKPSTSIKRRKTTKRKTAKRKTVSRKGKRSHASYVKAGKKAARTRARKKAARSASAKKASRKRTRKSPRKTTRRKYTKKRKTTRATKSRKRSLAMKKAWRKRRKGFVKQGRKKIYYKTKRRTRYKKAVRRRGSVRKRGYPLWRNATKAWLMTIGIGGAGLLAAEMLSGFVQKKANEKGYGSKLMVAGANVLPIVVPLAASWAMMRYGSKIVKDAEVRSTLSIALGMIGALSAINQLIVPKLPANIQASMNMAGYVRSAGVRGYVRAMGSYPSSRLMSQGTMRGALPAPKPYGVSSGAGMDRRSYQKFDWGGVLGKGIFE